MDSEKLKPDYLKSEQMAAILSKAIQNMDKMSGMLGNLQGKLSGMSPGRN